MILVFLGLFDQKKAKKLIRISASTKVSRKVSICGRIWAFLWSSSSDGITSAEIQVLVENGGRVREKYRKNMGESWENTIYLCCLKIKWLKFNLS